MDEPHPPDEPPPSAGRLARVALLAAAVLGAACGRPEIDRVAAEAGLDTLPRASAAELLVGMNYTHHRFDGCPLEGRGILATLHEPGVEARVAGQLGAMRGAGLVSLRLLVWHMRDVPRQDWGVVPSRGGRLGRPYRTNLVRFLGLVDRAGFRRLTVSFSPQWENSPLLDRYRPERLEENWSFLRDVRSLVRAHGPPEVRFDLLNEGAPSDHLPDAQRARMAGYVGEMWRRYARAYGTGDVTVSVIAPSDPRDRGRRLENLLAIVREAEVGRPTWFELHLNRPAPGVARGLRHADSVLAAHGVAAPLTLGETAYDDPAVADSVAAFRDGATRELEEILPWYLRAGGECALPPPYTAESYLRLAR